MSEHILVTLPSFSDDAKPGLEAIGAVTYDIPTQEHMDASINQYAILVVGLGITFHKETLEKATNLKILATATTGLDHIDVAYAESKGIQVVSLKNEKEFLDTITGTAELAFGLMIDLLRMTPSAACAVTEKGEWRREDYRGQSLYGKTLGIVGMGRLGKIMAAGAAGFRMNVIYCDPYVEQDVFPDYKKVSFDALLQESDVVAVHVHLSDETENMFSTDAFVSMKNTAVLINTARGKIVDEEAVIKALEERQFAGYATDVLSGELDFPKTNVEDPLITYAKGKKNVIIVPHIGGMTADSRIATDIFIAEKTVAHLGDVVGERSES